MTQTDIYRLLAKKYNLSFIEIRRICNSSYRFIHERMVEQDQKPILLSGLFRFKMKHKYERKNTTTSKN